jgi:hypothetical protein
VDRPTALFVVGAVPNVHVSPTLGPPIGETFDAMIRNFKSRRDKEFASHICANTRTRRYLKLKLHCEKG